MNTGTRACCAPRVGHASCIVLTSFPLSLSFLPQIKLATRLGMGQFGDVYSGEWLDTKVAVKIPRLPSPDSLRDFLREVKLMSILHHPNIVLFLGACITKPDICLVMEYLPRGSLFQYIHDPNSEKSDLQMLGFAVDCARGMKYLHHRVKLVQRDLKSR